MSYNNINIMSLFSYFATIKLSIFIYFKLIYGVINKYDALDVIKIQIKEKYLKKIKKKEKKKTTYQIFLIYN